LVAAGIVAEENSIFQTLMSMQPTFVLKPIVPPARSAMAPNETEPALNVVTVYQDPLTRNWATELWDRVGQLVGQETLCRKSWKIPDLMEPSVFTEAVQVAAAADVLVVSVRDTGALPINLCVWISAWLPRRNGRAGALVALIGVPPRPDAQGVRVYGYLEAVARRAGLDFLPRARKLPEEPLAIPSRQRLARQSTARYPCGKGYSAQAGVLNVR